MHVYIKFWGHASPVPRSLPICGIIKCEMRVGCYTSCRGQDISKHVSPATAAEDDDASKFDVTAPHLGHLLCIIMGVSLRQSVGFSSTTKSVF